MNNFFKIHKVKILRGNDNFKFLGSFFRLPLPLPRQRRVSSVQVGLRKIPCFNIIHKLHNYKLNRMYIFCKFVDKSKSENFKRLWSSCNCV